MKKGKSLVWPRFSAGNHQTAPSQGRSKVTAGSGNHVVGPSGENGPNDPVWIIGNPRQQVNLAASAYGHVVAMERHAIDRFASRCNCKRTLDYLAFW
jgi:hypothetical protein